MYKSYPDNIPQSKTSTACPSVAAEEAEHGPLRQNSILIDSQPRYPSSKRSTRWWQRVGWPVGALGSAMMATTALLLNLTVLVWVSSAFKFERGIAQVFAGDCHQAEKINTWVHFGINAVSTMLLSGSNYCMQILSAPTRKELDKAHAKQEWLDIGVPSVRNLRNIAKRKVVMWWLLGLSSLPLHLLYNSCFFMATATNEYDIIFATKAFVEGGPLGAYNEAIFKGLNGIQTRAKTWDRLEQAECINAYATEFLNARRNLVAVVTDRTPSKNDSVKRVVPYRFNLQSDPYAWICDAQDGELRYGYNRTLLELRGKFHCSSILPKIRANAGRWHSNGRDIDYCLSEPVVGTCELNFSLLIIIVVMVCNMGKALLMFLVAFRAKGQHLITIGDAIDSFLNFNDQTTRQMCLSSKESIEAGEVPQRSFDMIDYYEARHIHQPRDNFSRNWKAGRFEYKSSPERWFNATTRVRSYSCIALLLGCLLIVAIFLAAGMITANGYNGAGLSAKGFLALGVGTINRSTLLPMKLPSIGGTTVIASVLIANLPQPILSFLYLFFNGIFISMLLADEWSDFAHERKPLRVSDPKPGQRSTYFLQLPYRYGVPLIVFSGILHWSVGQSIFMARVQSFSKDGDLVDPAAISTCGYSPSAITITMITGVCLALFLSLLSLRRYKAGIPLAGSVSAAISAACHARGDVDSTAPLQWGVTSPEGEEVGHCAFSDKEVRMPVEGRLYAGGLKVD